MTRLQKFMANSYLYGNRKYCFLPDVANPKKFRKRRGKKTGRKIVGICRLCEGHMFRGEPVKDVSGDFLSPHETHVRVHRICHTDAVG